MGAAVPPTAQDAAAALVVAYKSKHGAADPPRNAIVLPLAQLMGEGSLSRYFLGTNNLGAMHATANFARVHAGDRGFGMVAFLDHAPGPVAYISRMSVYPSLSNGARSLIDLLERMVSLSSVSDVNDFSTQLYAHNYFEGMAAPATPSTGRAAALASNSWTSADQTNIAAYASLISQNEAAAGAAFDALPSYTGDPSAVNSGPPFAPLADRLTPSAAYAPHTLDHARALLGAAASSPPSGGISLDDALGTPDGDGVWLFGLPAPTPAPTVSPVGQLVAAASSRKAAVIGFAIAGASLAALALGSAALPKNWPSLVLSGVT